MQSILIVDDKNENLVALESLLERPDLALLKAENGNDALRLLLKTSDVALVLLDVQMPGMSGFEMAELMRRNKRTQSIPIIFVTANGDKQQLFRGYEVGAVDYLAKPIEREVLLSKVKVFLELDRQRRELELKLAEIQLLKLKNDQLLHALGDGVLAVDASGDISFVNPAIQHLFSIEPESLVGRAIDSILFQNSEGNKTLWGKSEIYMATQAGSQLHRSTGFYVICDGNIRPVQVSAAPIPSPDTTYVGAVVTLRKLSDEESDAYNEKLAKKNRIQTRKNIKAVLRIFDRTNGMNLGRLINISNDGFKISSREHIQSGKSYNISMILPEPLVGSSTLSFDAQAVWCGPAEDAAGEHRVGFRITRISDNDKCILQQLINKY